MYRAISDYGLIGDMHAVALVSKQGSIDYCSMPHIDSPTVFASLLDDEKGGYFSINPEGEFSSQQEYIKDTNILKCRFNVNQAEAELIDFMPVNTQELFDKGEHLLHRCVRVLTGAIDFVLKCSPRPQYASESPRIENRENIFKIKAKSEIFTLVLKIKDYEIIEKRNGNISLKFSLKQGESAHFDFIYGEGHFNEERECRFAQTQDFWLSWLHDCAAGKCIFLGEYADMINRSLLVLKLLTFQPTGAIAAAATTSLPESIGGKRNWDYRFTWIRDASFTLKALFNLGHISEADSFIRWLHKIYEKYGRRNLQIMYSFRGESRLEERLLMYLKGYRNSKPVRIGNNAYKQRQWDVFGEIMDSALRLSDYAGKINEDLWPFFRDVCNLACRNWRLPDQGIWELRNGPLHFVYSKAMCWVALDRGIKISKRYGFDAPLERWIKERDRIKGDILKNGFDKQINSFVKYYGSKELDSSNLLLGLMGFLPFDDRRIQGTIEMCRKQLMKNGFLLRYHSYDGLEGEEGAFILCNFWLAECLALSGKIKEAKDVLTTTLKAANHLGLFSEEHDYKNNQMLGNFPQAFSHIGFINAVSTILNIEYKLKQDDIQSRRINRIKKLLPFKIILNKDTTKFRDTDRQIARQLKIAINNLQGAFFNTLEGKVDYETMKKSENYTDYIRLSQKLNAFNPFNLHSDEDKKAFWINIYNIVIIHGVIELGIKDSVKEVFNFFRRIGYKIGGLFFTPDDIEHGILRLNKPHPVLRIRQFSWLDTRRKLCLRKFDPRIHFAIVCASSSCPPVEFYDARDIDNQLDIAARSFVNRKGVVLDRVNNYLYLSQIFKWYASDFADTERGVVDYVLGFVNESKKWYIENNLGKIKIRYLPYNWNLNKAL